ncbi:MAG: Fic family protein [Dysgonamonadaceae bacterium]|jgi:Fic family protein|nr:Fic family protein [Dysgonamonadaceae bacterium]
MNKSKNISALWQTVQRLSDEYSVLNLDETIDYEKYKLYSIVISSTQLEGVSLTEIEAQLLLDEGLTAKGKPLVHHLMICDNHNAIKLAMKAGEENRSLTPELLKELNAVNMASTGQTVSSALGTVDGKTGNFRLVNAFSEALGYYTDPQKIQTAIDAFCKHYETALQNIDMKERLSIIFDAHVNLVLIHPWMDGNKRTSRLLMNYLQRRFNIPLTKVYKEDGEEYIACLKEAKDKGDNKPFRTFMLGQHIKTLQNELSLYQNKDKQNTAKKGFAMFF